MKISEVPGALTLEQLEQMDGQRVLMPETALAYGGFGIVNTKKRIIQQVVPKCGGFEKKLFWFFADYGSAYVALKDPYDVLEVD